MDKTQKIGKNARDIFASTSNISNPSAPPVTPDIEKPSIPLPAAILKTDSILTDVITNEGEVTTAGRGRPQLHQEPVSKITTVLLNRHVVYLDGISNEIRQQSGAVVKRSEILRALVEALEAAQPDLNQVRPQADLTEILRVRLQLGEEH